MKIIPKNYIRFSCGSLARIAYGKKFVLLLHKTSARRGIRIFSSVGGGLEYTRQGKAALQKLGATHFEGKDLRFFAPKKNIPAVAHWFANKHGREIGPEREIREELTKETKLLTPKDLKKMSLSFVGYTMSMGFSPRFAVPVKTLGVMEIYDLTLPASVVAELVRVGTTRGMVILASKTEIARKKTRDGDAISKNTIKMFRTKKKF